MTDTSYPVTAFPAQSHPGAVLSPNGQLATQHSYGAPPVDGIKDDDGQISCECGYADDDGWTVACDACNRWQHQLCYYPEYEDQRLPDDLQHYCVDCRPREFDRHAAHARQKVKREEQASLVNGIKRAPASKSHKKKPKESTNTNGWPLDRARHERTSASPRDQPPPAKRPKTSHRTSDSTTSAPTTSKGHARKRTASNVHHRRSPSRSPESMPPLYSPEFIQRYRDDDWRVPPTNLHNSIELAESLSEWLSIPDEKFIETHNHHKSEVLMRWDGQLDDIPGKADIDIQDITDERVPLPDGPPDFVTWKTVFVKEPVASGAYIGELKGHVGFKDDYVSDPSNRWSLLRHPEPFVFFHPKLPIYVDARDEGTELRYVRRSCSPNAHLQVLVTDAQDYRFCFMATEQIDPGTEIAVAWDTLHGYGLEPSSPDIPKVISWVSNVLSNCGPCACTNPDCPMGRFDHRLDPNQTEVPPPATKPTKSKGRKARQNISPLNTQVHSRSGSEARKIDADDEPTDSRSASGSAGRNSASRDITPNTHYSHNGSLSAVPELSERERKKLAKEEEMFRRQEEEQTSGRQSKKKRPSGGSSLNTPSATSSKQLGFGAPSSKYADAGTSRQAGLPLAKVGSGGRRAKGSSATPKPRKTITKIVKRPTPDYVDTAVQCDMDAEEEKPVQLPVRRRPFLSTTQRLLQRCAVNNSKRKRTEDGPMSNDDRMDIDSVSPSSKSPKQTSIIPDTAGSLSTADAQLKRETDQAQDVEMEIAPPVDAVETKAPPIADAAHAVKESAATTSSAPNGPSKQDLPTNPPAPPWPSQASHTTAPTPHDQPQAHLHNPKEMHLEMPPPPSNPFSHSSNPSPSSVAVLSPEPNTAANTPNGPPQAAATTMTSQPPLTQSPSALQTSSSSATAGAAVPPLTTNPPLFSPTVTAAVNPSPARKKLSLSDYTRRNKKADTKDGDSGSAAATTPGAIAAASPAAAAAGAAATAPAGEAPDADKENHVGKDKVDAEDGVAEGAVKPDNVGSPVLVPVSGNEGNAASATSDVPGDVVLAGKELKAEETVVDGVDSLAPAVDAAAGADADVDAEKGLIGGA